MGVFRIQDEGSLRISAKGEGGELVTTDAAKEDGGLGEHVSPTDLFAVSLAHCILTVLSILASRMKVEIGQPTAEVEKVATKTPPIRIQEISIHIHVPADVDETVRQQLEERSSIYCPVSSAIHPDVKKNIRFTWGASA